MKMLAHKRAVELRKQGRSIRAIARMLGVSPSSVSGWCRSIELAEEQRKRLAISQRKAAQRALAPLIAGRKNAKAFDFATQAARAREDVGGISSRDLFILGLGLYWGEGYKRGSEEWGFTNSDPAIIRTILAWLLNSYGVGIERVIARVTINVHHASRADAITRRWSRETGIPRGQFGQPSFVAGYKKSKLREETYRGTLRIKIRSGTSLRRRTLASIAIVQDQIVSNSRKKLRSGYSHA